MGKHWKTIDAAVDPFELELYSFNCPDRIGSMAVVFRLIFLFLILSRTNKDILIERYSRLYMGLTLEHVKDTCVRVLSVSESIAEIGFERNYLNN